MVRKIFSPEQKLALVLKMIESKDPVKVCREAGVDPKTGQDWLRQFKSSGRRALSNAGRWSDFRQLTRTSTVGRKGRLL